MEELFHSILHAEELWNNADEYQPLSSYQY